MAGLEPDPAIGGQPPDKQARQNRQPDPAIGSHLPSASGGFDPTPAVRRRRVADFPRPPAIEKVSAKLRIIFGGRTIAETDAAWRILETFHPPTYYVPQSAFPDGTLRRTARTSFCEWKGLAHYYDITSGESRAAEAGWGYDTPVSPYEALRAHVAIYAGRMGACFVGAERVTPQQGGFYGGWITSEFEGPFKGAPGTNDW